MLLDCYSPTPYHYATLKVGHLPLGLNQGASNWEEAFDWGQVMRDTWPGVNDLPFSVYKISSKLDDFSSRYGDFTIFKMADLCHLEFDGSNSGPIITLLDSVSVCQKHDKQKNQTFSFTDSVWHTMSMKLVTVMDEVEAPHNFFGSD